MIGSSVTASLYAIHHLHVPQWRGTRGINHTKNPLLVICPSSSVVLWKWKCKTVHTYTYTYTYTLCTFFTLCTLGLCLKRDSSIWTITPTPPSTTGPSLMSLVEHTSLNHWYTSIAVFRTLGGVRDWILMWPEMEQCYSGLEGQLGLGKKTSLPNRWSCFTWRALPPTSICNIRARALQHRYLTPEAEIINYAPDTSPKQDIFMTKHAPRLHCNPSTIWTHCLLVKGLTLHTWQILLKHFSLVKGLNLHTGSC